MKRDNLTTTIILYRSKQTNERIDCYLTNSRSIVEGAKETARVLPRELKRRARKENGFSACSLGNVNKKVKDRTLSSIT